MSWDLGSNLTQNFPYDITDIDSWGFVKHILAFWYVENEERNGAVVCRLRLGWDGVYRDRGGWGKAPMWGKGPTTEITFMDGNRGNICTRVFSYVIGPPVAVDADGENTS